MGWKPAPQAPYRRGRMRGWLKRRGAVCAAAVPLAVGSIGNGQLAALPRAPGPRGAATAEQTAIEQQPVCVGSSVASAGALSDVLYYRAMALADGRVAVGYFAFFSEERPWGNNWLTWSVVPALAVDLVYSRALLVGPGLQRAMYGAGDVEGFRIMYGRSPDGALHVDEATADDRTEEEVALSRADVFRLDRERPTFYSDVWSHQLGARGARSRADLAYVRCYQGSDAIRPLPDAVAREFRIDGRADPAHVETMNGRRIDVTDPTPAIAKE
jgi:hypothetical protein